VGLGRGQVTSWSGTTRCISLYGFPRSDFPGAFEAWEQVVHPEDRELEVEKLQRALRGEEEFNTEFRAHLARRRLHPLHEGQRHGPAEMPAAPAPGDRRQLGSHRNGARRRT